MKKILIAAFMMFSISALQAQISITDTEVRLTVDNTTTRNELLDMRNTLAEQNIDFRYTEVAWNDDQLLRIKMQIKSPDGRIRNFETTELANVGAIKMTYKLNSTEEDDFCLGVNCE